MAHISLRAAVLALLLATAAPAPAQQAQASTQKPWWERLTFYGDFRARYDGQFAENIAARQRGQYRFRFGVRTPVVEGLDFNVRLASGEAADVTSTNQNLGGFQNRKPINIDQVSLAFTPQKARALTLGVGKYAYPMTRTQMVWDDDVNWEGAYEQVGWRRGAGASAGGSAGAGATTFRVVAAQVTMNEVPLGDDAFLFGHAAQAGFTAGGHTLQVQVADYLFRNPDQIAVALDQRTQIRTQSTNAVRRDDAGRVVGYVSGFHLVDAIAQVTFDTGKPPYPLVATADFVMNTRAAGDDDSGVWLSAAYGRAATAGTFAATYTFTRIERDAVVSAFNFSDMVPATNVVMNMATFSYMPRSRVNLDAIFILTRPIEAPGALGGPPLKRLQIDARISF